MGNPNHRCEKLCVIRQRETGFSDDWPVAGFLRKSNTHWAQNAAISSSWSLQTILASAVAKLIVDKFALYDGSAFSVHGGPDGQS